VYTYGLNGSTKNRLHSQHCRHALAAWLAAVFLQPARSCSQISDNLIKIQHHFGANIPQGMDLPLKSVAENTPPPSKF
jgi:phosphopantetheine adenylyltransferase